MSLTLGTYYLPPNVFNNLLSSFNLNDNIELYYYTIIYVLYWTGLRIGELAALTPDDFKNDCLIINKDYMRVAGVDYVLTPKTQNSIRTVYLDSMTIDVIKKYISVYNPKKRLFESKNEYLSQPKLRRYLQKKVKECNLDSSYDIHLHSLRHSHASYLRSLGYDEFAISSRLGNTPKVSASTYIHTTPEELKKLTSYLDKEKSGN